MGKLNAATRVADEVWIATALLHREQPDARDFSLKAIAARLVRQGGTIVPSRSRIPLKYHPLLDWYERDWAPAFRLRGVRGNSWHNAAS